MRGEVVGQKSPKVTFVLINWNQPDLTLECLASLRQQVYPNFDVVVVDNGSTDDSCVRIQAQYPEAVLIRNERNIGYSPGNNVGIRQALADQCDYIFLLNNDTVVDPQMLNRLVAVAESSPDIGATGPTMLYFDQPDIVWCAGNSLDWQTGESRRLDEGCTLRDINRSAIDRPCRDVDFFTSCAVLVKSALFQEIGLLDERYFIYYEEIDWFARAQRAGWRTVHVPDARMWHKVSATMGQASPRTDYYMVRNRFLFLKKNLCGRSRVTALRNAVTTVCRDILAFTVKSHGGSRTGNRNAKLIALYDAFRSRWGEISPTAEAFCRNGS